MKFLKRILLVDYEPQVTALIRSALEETGDYLIREEHDGRRASHAARWFQPDLILLDVMGAAPEAARIPDEWQQDGPNKPPVMFLSSANGRVATGGVLHGYSFLANPVPIEEFVRCVSELLNPR